MNKKKILALALVLIMLATISFSTLAWFTDKDEAVNDFTIGGAGQEDADKIFSVDVKEKVDGEEGEQIVEGMLFEKILPGDDLKKEAYITNTGSYEQYIRVVMTISDWALIEDLVTINMADDVEDNWEIRNADIKNGVLVDYSNSVIDENGNLVVTMYLNKKLQPGETVNIMESVEISTEATQKDFANAAFADGFQITFDADAAQTEHILPRLDDREWRNAQLTFEALEKA